MILSIITVVYNSQDVISDCIESIRAIKSDDVEYIIIDGNSTDNTLKIIDKYVEYVDILISEPDNGIYDAMNKGVRASKGKYILFINADDRCCVSGFKSIMDELKHTDIDFLYSYVFVHSFENLSVLKPHKNFPNYNINIGNMPICHQGVIAKRTLLTSDGYSFDTAFKLSADINWVFKILRNENISYKYLDIGFSSISLDGRSSSFLSIYETSMIMYKNKCNIFSIIFYFLRRSIIYILINFGIYNKIKQFLPSKFFRIGL